MKCLQGPNICFASWPNRGKGPPQLKGAQGESSFSGGGAGRCPAKCGLGAPWRPAVSRRHGMAGAPPDFFGAVAGRERASGLPEGQMGPKTGLVGQLGAARSRQDEPIEVGEVSGVEMAVFGVQWGACHLV
jgi:hypothetical protein